MEKIFNLLVGCLLGDAHIRRNKDGSESYITFEQTINHKEYVLSLYQILSQSGLKLKEIKYYARDDKRHASVNNSIYFRTEATDLLNPLANLFLSVNEKKIIKSDIEKYLDPVALAYWICDDGQLVKRGGITLCTDSYTLPEVELLIQILENKYKLKCTIHIKKGISGNEYHRIYIGRKSLYEIKPLLISHMHKYFLYKLHE
jgi:hypothetical protein